MGMKYGSHHPVNRVIFVQLKASLLEIKLLRIISLKIIPDGALICNNSIKHYEVSSTGKLSSLFNLSCSSFSVSNFMSARRISLFNLS